MIETSETTHINAKPGDSRRLSSASKPPVRVGEMTHMVLITIALALLTGVLAVPLTMRGMTFVEPLMAFGAADFSQLSSVLTSARLA